MIPLKKLFTFVRTQLNNFAFWWDNRSSSVRFWIEAQFGPEARFLKAPITFRAQKPVLCLSCLHSRSIILKMIQWNYQFTKQNWPVCGPGTMLLFNRFWFQNLPLYAKSYLVFRERSPWSQLENKTIPLQYNLRSRSIFVSLWKLHSGGQGETITVREYVWEPLKLGLISGYYNTTLDLFTDTAAILN